MSSEIAIRAAGLGKRFRIYPTPKDRLKQFLVPKIARVFRLRPRDYFSEFTALEDVSFEVRRGETFGIVGRNGSGKSTLLQLICGTLKPTQGTVEIHGRIAALLELGAGFNPDFTGRENVFMNARVLGLTQREIEERFDSIRAFADIGEFIDRQVKTYSSGMYVRLAFAVIAHVDADILVIDEALSVGDAYFVQKCMRFLRGFMERGTLLFVSHDTGAVLNLCTRAVLLERGHALVTGTPKDVVHKYLEALVESNQGTVASTKGEREAPPERSADEDDRDVRQELVDGSSLRNDIEIFSFNPAAAAFGTGLAEIESVALMAEPDGAHLSWTVGGERVSLKIRARAFAPIAMPIIGFQVMDRLGQCLFGDNTYLSHRDMNLSVRAGGAIQAVFEFRMPVLPTGDYSICVAVADGTQDSHVQHHWVHEALVIRANATSMTFGLVGIPMKRIELTTP